jgi:hypothetical protein
MGTNTTKVGEIMDKYEVLNWLLKQGFVVERSDQFYPNIFLEKEHIGVVVKEYKEDPSENTIINDSVEIRLKFKKMNKNSWNSYFLILLPANSELSPYIIEKDPRGIRKYVVSEFHDFKRIPFLDSSRIEEEETKINNLSLTKIYEDTKIKNILEYIIKSGGNSRSLTKEEINSAFYKLFDLEDIVNED